MNTFSHFSPEMLQEEATNNPCVAFKIFTEKKSQYGANHPFCFIEGYDEPYYEPRVNAISEESGIFIVCGGKKGVIESYRYIKSKYAYSNYRLLFFVDRDYDDNSGLTPDFFVTDGYSVENYYCSASVIEKVLRDFASIRDDREEEKNAAIALFHEWEICFFESTRLFCAWYANIKGRDDRKTSDKKYKTSFPAKYTRIDKDGIEYFSYSLEDLNSDYGLQSPVTGDELLSASDRIISVNDIRGKYVIQLVQEFIEHLRLDSIRRKRIIKKPFSFEKNNQSILARLTGAADSSDSLRDYLKRHLL